MGSARKRGQHEVDDDASEQPKESSTLQRIRNMWQFANLCQFIMLFGKAVKVDDGLDVDELEMDCLKPHSLALQEIGLAFLKYLSSHRGLTHELFDEYTRRQFAAKTPERNPFGTEEAPAKFADFDVLKKIRVLHQMTQLIMMNPEKLREKMPEQKDAEQANWRIEPVGWDRDERTYFLLDDNRVYRQTDAPPAVPKPKKNTKKARASLRASKRRRISAAPESEAEEADAEPTPQPADEEGDDLGGMKWECVAVTLPEVQQLLAPMQKTRDEDEKILRDQLQEHLVPLLEKQEESRKRKQQMREKELLNLEKMAHAKRSSRLAGKAQQQKHEEQAREQEAKQRLEEVSARKEEEKRLKMERDRDNRLKSREHRLRERETRRLQHQEELAQLSEDSRGGQNGRMSERHRQAAIERKRRALEELEDEEEDWIFDCVCGVYGQIDDGTHSVSCERCNVWQHSKCLGIAKKEAEKDDFHFICEPCRRAAEEPNRAKVIKIKVKGSEASSSPPSAGKNDLGQKSYALPPPDAANPVVELPSKLPSKVMWNTRPLDTSGAALVNGPMSTPGPSQAIVSTPSSTNGHKAHPFSSPHPTLSPPNQSPNKARRYDTISSYPTNGINTLQPADGLPPRATADAPTLSATAVSPVKTPTEPLQINKPVLSPPALSPSSANFPIPKKASQARPPSASSMMTPRFNPSQSDTNYDERSSPLPMNPGFSPTKNSPPVPQLGSAFNSFNSNVSGGPAAGNASPTPPVVPPVASLSPSPRQQILTPPVKHAEPNRAP